MSSMCQGMNTMPRIKKPVSLALDPDLLERLDAWISKQEFKLIKTDIWETALREFLDKRETAPGRKK